MKNKIKILLLLTILFVSIALLATLGDECPDCGHKMVKSDRTGNNFCTYCDEWK